jgi:acid stress-induced BolA-like protein IbaG/YrbA
MEQQVMSINAEEIKQLIEAGVPDAKASISGQGDKFDAIVISPAFEGKNMVQQHQLVYGTLGSLMQDNVIHALSLRTYTPEQWSKQTPLQQ